MLQLSLELLDGPFNQQVAKGDPSKTLLGRGDRVEDGGPGVRRRNLGGSGGKDLPHRRGHLIHQRNVKDAEG